MSYAVELTESYFPAQADGDVRDLTLGDAPEVLGDHPLKQRNPRRAADQNHVIELRGT